MAMTAALFPDAGSHLAVGEWNARSPFLMKVPAPEPLRSKWGFGRPAVPLFGFYELNGTGRYGTPSAPPPRFHEPLFLIMRKRDADVDHVPVPLFPVQSEARPIGITEIAITNMVFRPAELCHL